MKCVILAAGEGKRMHPLTYTRPKVMLPIANRPILEWNLMNAKKAGLRDFIFVVGYKSEMVRTYFEKGEQWNTQIEYVHQGKALGTAHAVSMVERFVDDFIVMCGDTIFGTDGIKHIIDNNACMGAVEVENACEYGVVETKNNMIAHIYEKMAHPTSNLINAGIYHFNKQIFDFVKETNKSPRGEYEITDSINLMVQKKPMKSILLQQWRDVVYPWHLLDANEELLKDMRGKQEGTIEKNATIKGKVIVGKNTVVRSGSYIEGPVIIGNDCIIGPNCFIRSFTAIGNGCHIGNASEVKNSIIMNYSNVPHQNYVGDSVIGEQCNLGAGTKIANLRLDKKTIAVILNGKKIDTGRKKLGGILGDHVQTGINATINVGSIAGNEVWIGPGTIAQGEMNSRARVL